MKVIYNTYSCAKTGMSREMMKMDGRDSAEYQNWEKRDIMVILGFVLMRIKPKYGIVPSPSLRHKPKREMQNFLTIAIFERILERER